MTATSYRRALRRLGHQLWQGLSTPIYAEDQQWLVPADPTKVHHTNERNHS